MGVGTLALQGNGSTGDAVMNAVASGAAGIELVRRRTVGAPARGAARSARRAVAVAIEECARRVVRVSEARTPDRARAVEGVGYKELPEARPALLDEWFHAARVMLIASSDARVPSGLSAAWLWLPRRLRRAWSIAPRRPWPCSRRRTERRSTKLGSTSTATVHDRR